LLESFCDLLVCPRARYVPVRFVLRVLAERLSSRRAILSRVAASWRSRSCLAWGTRVRRGWRSGPSGSSVRRARHLPRRWVCCRCH